MSRITSALVALATLPLLASTAQAGPDFAHELSPKVQWYTVAETGHLLAANNTSVVAIDPDSGDIAWTRDDLKKVTEDAIEVVPNTPTALVLENTAKIGSLPTGTVHLVDLTTGEDLWTLEGGPVMWTRPHLKDGGLLLLQQNSGNKGPDWTMSYVDIKTGEVRFAKHDYFDKSVPILRQWKARPDKKWSTKMTLEGNQPVVWVDGGKAYLELWHAKQGLVKRDAATGDVIWTRPAKYAGKMVPTPRDGKPALLVDGGNVYVTDNGASLFGYSIADGTPLWDEKKGPKMPGTIYVAARIDQGLLVTGNNGKVSFAQLMDPTTGELKWKKPVKMKGLISFLEARDNGTLVLAETKGAATILHVLDLADGSARVKKPARLPGGLDDGTIDGDRFFATGSNGSKTYVGMWDLNSGESTWEGGKGYRAKGTVPNLVVRDDKVFFVDSRGNFTALSYADGSEIFSEKLPLDGKDETPAALRDRGDVLTTWSSQNVVTLDPATGKVVSHAHYPPPPPTGLQIAAGAAMIAASAAATAAQAQASAQAGYAAGTSGYYSSAASHYRDQAEDLGNVASAFGDAAADVMRRAKASQASENYYFILTRVAEEDDKGVGLVRVSLDDASEAGKVIIDERDPDYQIDEIGGWLYLLRNEKQLEGYRFGESLVAADSAQ